jgi:hypothetical protein
MLVDVHYAVQAREVQRDRAGEAVVHGLHAAHHGVACVTGRKRRTALLEAESHERRVTSTAGRPTANVIVDLGAGRPYQAKGEAADPLPDAAESAGIVDEEASALWKVRARHAAGLRPRRSRTNKT